MELEMAAAGFDYSQIRAILPHGHPMVLVDRIISFEPGVSITGIKAVTGCEPCYRDLAENLAAERYAYPTSLLLESFGQTGAILWRQSVTLSRKEDDSVLMFVVARDCRIEGRAFPGDVLRHQVRLDRMMDDHVFITGEICVEDRRIAIIGSMLAVTRPRSVVAERAIAGRM
jgi:3-hydroxyacyl-[acyl-carrier-protein] dehydratase